jgi:hypothetical protein
MFRLNRADKTFARLRTIMTMRIHEITLGFTLRGDCSCRRMIWDSCGDIVQKRAMRSLHLIGTGVSNGQTN